MLLQVHINSSGRHIESEKVVESYWLKCWTRLLRIAEANWNRLPMRQDAFQELGYAVEQHLRISTR
jgi:hypothetical protein